MKYSYSGENHFLPGVARLNRLTIAFVFSQQVPTKILMTYDPRHATLDMRPSTCDPRLATLDMPPSTSDP